MKINEKNLLIFASSATPVDREGWLEMRCEVGKSYHKRWFVLKGNLLFYFEKHGDKEPIGVVILEGYFVELTEEEEAFSFKLVFHSASNRAYYFCTDSQASMEAWMKALACASYDYMKLMVNDLQTQLVEAEADAASEASCSSASAPNDEPKVPPRSQRHNPFNKPEDGSKSTPLSRHKKENQRPVTIRKKVPFSEIHTHFGRRIIADRNKLSGHCVNSLNETTPDSLPVETSLIHF